MPLARNMTTLVNMLQANDFQAKEEFVMASRRCPECGSTDVTKVGHYASNNTDEYVCNDCGEEFTVKCD